jgi:CRISPR-associated protein, Cmr2 family
MNLWKKKLAARLHDPAEKALVLMRDVDNQGMRIGHEDGSVAGLRKLLGIAKSEFDPRADHYAAAADRPQWPCEDGQPRPAWANVRFAEQAVLIHPLSGEEIALGKLNDIAAPHIRHASLDHFSELIELDETGQPDLKATLLAFWRFGPEPKLAAPELGELWRLLPADTRVPDHSIWAHLDVTSALAGALADDTPALLTMSFGPVQGVYRTGAFDFRLVGGLASALVAGVGRLARDLRRTRPGRGAVPAVARRGLRGSLAARIRARASPRRVEGALCRHRSAVAQIRHRRQPAVRGNFAEQVHGAGSRKSGAGAGGSSDDGGARQGAAMGDRRCAASFRSGRW